MTAVSDADRAKAATVHELKTWPSYFEAIADGTKTYELRGDDRGFAVGDVLRLREWSVGSGYTGNTVDRLVTHVLRDVPSFGLADGYVILSLAEARAPYDRLTADEAVTHAICEWATPDDELGWPGSPEVAQHAEEIAAFLWERGLTR